MPPSVAAAALVTAWEGIVAHPVGWEGDAGIQAGFRVDLGSWISVRLRRRSAEMPQQTVSFNDPSVSSSALVRVCPAAQAFRGSRDGQGASEGSPLA